jgi:hypothetical protein
VPYKSRAPKRLSLSSPLTYDDNKYFSSGRGPG